MDKQFINAEDKVLLVDDVFGSGRSIQAIFKRIRENTGHNMPKVMKVACPRYKPSSNVTERKPDFVINETDKWLVFAHEIKGLTLSEIIQGKPELAAPIIKPVSVS